MGQDYHSLALTLFNAITISYCNKNYNFIHIVLKTTTFDLFLSLRVISYFLNLSFFISTNLHKTLAEINRVSAIPEKIEEIIEMIHEKEPDAYLIHTELRRMYSLRERAKTQNSKESSKVFFPSKSINCFPLYN